MLIGELAAKTGLSRDTIRFYEKHGLISLSDKQRRDNNYKEYPEETVSRLLMVKRLKDLDFTLNETTDLLAILQEKIATCDDVEEMFNQKVMELDEKRKEMIALRDHLLDSIRHSQVNITRSNAAQTD